MPIELKVPWRTDVCTNLEAARRLHLFVSFSVDLVDDRDVFGECLLRTGPYSPLELEEASQKLSSAYILNIEMLGVSIASLPSPVFHLCASS